jgi:hypothetical protein
MKVINQWIDSRFLDLQSLAMVDEWRVLLEDLADLSESLPVKTHFSSSLLSSLTVELDQLCFAVCKTTPLSKKDRPILLVVDGVAVSDVDLNVDVDVDRFVGLGKSFMFQQLSRVVVLLCNMQQLEAFVDPLALSVLLWQSLRNKFGVVMLKLLKAQDDVECHLLVKTLCALLARQAVLPGIAQALSEATKLCRADIEALLQLFGDACPINAHTLLFQADLAVERSWLLRHISVAVLLPVLDKLCS